MPSECARIANDEMAELVAKHPARFVTACACLPMSDVDAALAEMERAITVLGFRGVEMFTDINGKPLDAPEFLPLFERMQALRSADPSASAPNQHDLRLCG